MNAASLQQQILELQAQLTLLRETSTATITAQRAEIESLTTENKLLRGKLDAFIQRYFGKKSEALSEGQLELLLAGIEATAAPSVPEQASLKKVSRKRDGRTKVRTPENLEVVKVVIEPKEVQSQPDQWKEITQEVTRQLDYQPGKFFWLETVRPKYVKAEDKAQAPVVAPAPAKPCGMAAPGLLAYLLVSKFSDHLPFYRQQSIFQERHQVYIARQQMVLWMKQGVTLLEGIVHCIKEELRKSSYVQVDETPVK
ncbi:MAG: transposase [Chloroflexi bacterium]|nr:transposase [Chloroflexota bacterium]